MEDWISTQEELPAPLTDVLVWPTYDQPDVGMAYLKPNRGWYLSGLMSIRAQVTHWRPMPAPPAIRSDA